MQESLRNIAKHANVKKAEVLLTGTDEGIQFCIKDHEIGFDPVGIRGNEGFGLASTEELISNLGIFQGLICLALIFVITSCLYNIYFFQSS